MSTPKTPKQSEDLISNIQHIVLDKIFELLPIQDAARTSVLSKQWRCNWLSLKRLVFKGDFFYEGDELHGDGCLNWQERSNIISGILLHHNGPVHEFTLSVQEYVLDDEEESMSLDQNICRWLSFLSRNEIRVINIEGCCMQIPSYIFSCSELIHLELKHMTLNPPPSGFRGIPKLQHLLLTGIKFSKEDIFPRLMAKCKLATLKLENCWGLGCIVINVPSLETLIIVSHSGCDIAFGDVCNLKSISVRLYERLGKLSTVEIIDAFNNLARLRQLQYIEFGGKFCKILAGASIKKRPVPIVFNHLNELTLGWVDLSSLGVLQNILDMVESCPFMKKLVISIHSSNNAIHQKLGWTTFHKSPHLVKVKIRGICGSDVEIQLIEYLLTIGLALERLFYKSDYLDIDSEMKLFEVLLGMPRASPKARIVRLKY